MHGVLDWAIFGIAEGCLLGYILGYTAFRWLNQSWSAHNVPFWTQARWFAEDVGFLKSARDPSYPAPILEAIALSNAGRLAGMQLKVAPASEAGLSQYQALANQQNSGFQNALVGGNYTQNVLGQQQAYNSRYAEPPFGLARRHHG